MRVWLTTRQSLGQRGAFRRGGGAEETYESGYGEHLSLFSYEVRKGVTFVSGGERVGIEMQITREDMERLQKAWEESGSRPTYFFVVGPDQAVKLKAQFAEGVARYNQTPPPSEPTPQKN